MRHPPEDKWDDEHLKLLNPEPWQLELLDINPSYCCWGPHEDYMCGDNEGWASRSLCKNWTEFGPWNLDSLNECVNFYFELARESRECEHCEYGSSPEAQALQNEWYRGGWCKNLTQQDVDALVEAERLEKGATAQEINDSKYMHDAINKVVCVSARCEREGIEEACAHCEGHGRIYTAPQAHVNLVLWMLHPRKGCSKGVEVAHIQQKELPEVFKWLREARDRNANRFSKIPDAQ